MGNAVFLSENVFSGTQFPGHTVAGNEEPDGNEAYHVGTARRTASRNMWTTSTANAEATLSVAMDQPRGVDTFVLDRGHNLGGYPIVVEGSNQSDYSTVSTLASVTIPSSYGGPSDLDSAPGVVTEEGAWMIRVDLGAFQYLRLRIPAMGSGLKPQVVGFYAGKSFEPTFLLDLPWSWGGRELLYDSVVSDTAWVGATRPASRRTDQLTLKLTDEAEYDLARYHVESLFWRREVMWYVQDSSMAERSYLGACPPGTYAFQRRSDWAFMQASFPIVEHEPKILAGLGR